MADIFDALTRRRVHKARWSVADTPVRLEQMAGGGKLDPDCAGALASSPGQVGEILAHSATA